MLQPKRVKFRKSHKGHRRGKANSGNTIMFGEFGLQVLEPAWLTARQIEAARRAITRHIRRGGNVWIRIFPDKPVTKKAAETRMGSGKGAPDHWVAVVRPGRILFEMTGVPEVLAKEAMRLASHKLPVGTRFITRQSSTVSSENEAEEKA
ncbi:50S ribosomal protein L16 [Chloroflexota bacterium]